MPIHTRFSGPRPWLLRLAALCFAVLLVSACSSDSTGTPDDTGSDVEADVGPDIHEDTPEDSEMGERNCTPGASRCISDSSAEVCSDASEWEMVECSENQLCWGGECGNLGTCEPEAVDSCESFTRYVGCNPVGTGTGTFEVAFNQTCIEDDDGARLEQRLCFQGETECVDEDVLQRCSDSGLEWEFSTNCREQDATTLCDDGRCIPLCEFIEKLDTYVGCEYWAVDLDNIFLPPSDAFNSQFAVAVSNPDDELTADVTITNHLGVLATGSVEPHDMVVFQLPAAQIQGTMQGPEAYRVRSTVPIVAYQFNPLENVDVFSNDASILFPTSSLGTDYWVMTREHGTPFRSAMTLVATQDGRTDVTITLPPYTPVNQMITLAGDNIPVYRGGDTIEVSLQQFEVLNLETDRDGADFTGTFVEATRPLAVFGNSTAAAVPSTYGCVDRNRRCMLSAECPSGDCVDGRCEDDWVCAWDRDQPCWNSGRGEPDINLCLNYYTCCNDHIEQQMLPVFAWGRSYNATRAWRRCSTVWPHVCVGGRDKDEPCATEGQLACRPEGDVWRIMAGADNTEVRLVGLPDDVPLPGLGSEFLHEPTTRQWTGRRALDEGEWVEFQSFSDFHIQATGPIFVGHFLVGLHTPGANPPPVDDPMNGDPAFIMAVPEEQYRDDYIFLVPAEYAHNFVTIDAPLGTTVTHTDDTSTETWGPELFEVFGDGDFGVYRVELQREGYHRLTADAPFGVIVHGFDDDVSYGYPAGLDLKAINR